MRRGALALVLLLCGCATVPRAFLEAEDAIYQAIAPEYLRYVEEDPALSRDQKASRSRTLRAWRYSLDQAAKAAQE